MIKQRNLFFKEFVWLLLPVLLFVCWSIYLRDRRPFKLKIDEVDVVML